jgi:hypothetical protein
MHNFMPMAFRLAVVSVVLFPLGRLRAAEPGIDFFEQKVRPVLAQHCYPCHSTEAKKRRGGLLLDTRDGLRKGGDTGPAVVPGKPADSLLLKVVRYTEDGPRMPPKGKLPAAVIADLERWIALGAPDPRDGTATSNKKGIDLEQGRKFWAFQPPRRHPVPAVKDTTWAHGDIDRFILARLDSKGLRPVADADRVTLIRRAYFDLVGLPPSPEEIDDFVNDRSPDAFARVVDRLLASPHFGERWGRHWLDVARFAESSGGGRSLLFPDAWRYRDYVIEAFNTDRPYNRFVLEQIAGDLLLSTTPDERHRQLVATAFLVLGPTNYEAQDKDVLEMDVVDEQLDTIGRAFLGMTLGCARCHDHKFDPIPTRDYYALAGILKSTQTLIHDNVSRWVEQPLPVTAEQEAALKEHELAIAALQEKIRLAKEAEKKRALPSPPSGTRVPEAGGEGGDSKSLEAELKKLKDSGPHRPVTMAVKESAKIEDCQIRIRGITHNRGERVPRGFLQVASTGPVPELPAHESGRRQLGEWLSSRDNPLTARVMVNRVWQHLFGAGLVRTPDLFGATGEPPSHPELLDHLALDFQQDWSVKKLVRKIMLSRVYQLASAGQVEALAVDPENRLLWRRNRRRLEAEAIRDAILTVSGRLDRSLGGPNVKKGTTSEYGYQFDDTRRSVYTPVFRNRLLELFEAFDFADPNLVMGRRNVSTVPTQALYLMNSPFVMEQAHHAARAALAVADRDDAGRMERAYRLALGRLPSAGERQLALRFLAAAGDKPEQRLAAWERLYQVLFACLDFRYVN